MTAKPHRLRDRFSDIAAEGAAYLRRRRQERKPFARVYYSGGRSAAQPGDAQQGRALFTAASHLIEVAGPPVRRRERQARRASQAPE